MSETIRAYYREGNCEEAAKMYAEFKNEFPETTLEVIHPANKKSDVTSDPFDVVPEGKRFVDD